MLNHFEERKAVSVRVVETQGVEVLFLSSEEVALHKTILVQDSSANRARVCLNERRRTLRHEWLYFGTIYQGFLEPELRRPEEIRQSERVRVAVTFESDLLPGFQGKTVDLSKNGVQIQTPSPLEVRESVEIRLDLEDEPEPLQLWASVRWTRLGRPFYSGLQFLGVTAGQKTRLERFLDNCQESAHPRGSHSLCSPESESSVVLENVYLEDVYRKEDDLILRLLQEYSVIEHRFLNPHLTRTVCRQVSVRRVLSRRTPNGTVEYTYLGVDGRPVLQLNAKDVHTTISVL